MDNNVWFYTYKVFGAIVITIASLILLGCLKQCTFIANRLIEWHVKISGLSVHDHSPATGASGRFVNSSRCGTIIE